MKKSRRKFITFLLLCLTALCYVYLLRHVDIKWVISAVSLTDIVILSVLVVGMLLLRGIQTKLFLSHFKVPLSPSVWFGLAVLSSMASYLPLRGGMAAQAIYLKKIYRFPYSLFVSSLTASYAIVFFSHGVIGIAASLLALIRWDQFSFIIFFSFLLLIVFSVFVFLFGAKFSEANNRFIKLIAQVSAGIKHIKSDRRLLYQIVAIQSLACLIFAFRLYYVYRALSYDMPFTYCMILSPLAIVSMLVSITPAGLGFREIVIGAISKMIGHQFTEGVIVASLDRVVAMFWVFLLGGIFSYLLIAKSRKAESGEVGLSCLENCK